MKSFAFFCTNFAIVNIKNINRLEFIIRVFFFHDSNENVAKIKSSYRIRTAHYIFDFHSCHSSHRSYSMKTQKCTSECGMCMVCKYHKCI